MKQQDVRDAIDGLAFHAWLRSGAVPDDLAELGRSARTETIERKFNPYHDPANGRFTFAADGRRGYMGMTTRGLAAIRPIGGGGKDRNGRQMPELFATDPYALHRPADALAHYIGGTGEDRNFYFNNVDISHVQLADFHEMATLVAEGRPGLHPIVGALGSYNGAWLSDPHNISPAATVGGLSLRADGVLAIAKNGNYRFSGRLSADPDEYDFNDRNGRNIVAEASTTIGRQIPGKKFRVNIIGSKPFSAQGRR